MQKGKVFLTGAGPGDIGLITVKGLEAIKRAEVILYDRLANPKLLEFAPADCELIYCGKLPDRHTLRQESINNLLVEKALEGKTVVRLKGGDPGVFGRVGEEAEALANAEIEFEIIPGISSGIAAPLYTGIPVTHREFGETFAVVTAHHHTADNKPVLDWHALAAGIDTIAFYMGVANLPYICEKLIHHGKAPETPVILIQWGTFSRQKTLEGTLSTIAELAAENKMNNPAITLVGNIVTLRHRIKWFEKKPLFGRQILLARTGTQPGRLAKLLTEYGADVIEFPKWKSEKTAVDLKVIENLSHYKEILFTSAESVSVFFEILAETAIDIRMISATIFGLSKKTIAALREKGLQAEITSYREPSDTLLVIGDSRIGEHQYELCHTFITNKNFIDKKYVPILQRMITDAKPDTIIFPSSASVRMFFEEEQMNELYRYQDLKDINVVSMGAKTTSSLNFYGVKPDATAEKPTGPALIDAVLTCTKR